MTKNDFTTELTSQGYKRVRLIILYDGGIVLTTKGNDFDAPWTEDITLGAKTEINGRVIKDIANILGFDPEVTADQKITPIAFTEERLEVDSTPDTLMAKVESGWLHVAIFYEGFETPYRSSHMGRIAIITDEPV